jgi:hypothetical protein
MLPFPFVPSPEPFHGNIANLAQVYFLPVWKKLEGEKQVRFRISALAKMIKFLVALRRKLMKERIKRLSSWHLSCAYKAPAV